MNLATVTYWPDNVSCMKYVSRLKENYSNSSIDIDKKLANHLNWCKNNFALYRGLDTSHTNPLLQLQSIPPYNKSMPIQPGFNCILKSPIGCRIDSTSGTSGQSFKFYTSINERAIRKAYEIYGNSLLGLPVGNDHVVVWGGHETKGSFLKELKVAVVNVTSKRILCTVEGNDRKSLGKAKDILLRNKNGILITYPSMLIGMLEELDLTDLLSKYKSIILTGEAAPEYLYTDYQLDNLYSRYGSREFGLIAVGKGPETGYFNDRFVIENDENLGLLITDLEKKIMPLLRYPIGDFVSENKTREYSINKQEKANLAYLGKVDGRIFDVIQGKSGKKYIGTFWTLLMREVGVEKFRIRQHTPTTLEILYVGNLTPQSVQEKLGKNVNDDFDIRFSREEQIPETRNAKQKIVERMYD